MRIHGRKRREKHVQEPVVSFARASGWRCRKRSTQGRYGTNGEPDYEFIYKEPIRYMFLIEFKRPGETSTPLQQQMQAELRECGFDVYECDNVDYGKEIVAHQTIKAEFLCGPKSKKINSEKRLRTRRPSWSAKSEKARSPARRALKS